MLGLSCDSPVPPMLANICEITSKRCLPYFIAQWSDGTKRRDILAKIDRHATPFLVPTMIIQWTNCMKVLETFDRGVALLTSLCHNLVPRVSFLCLHCRWEKTFLNDNGGREERPWERGWLWQRKAARFFSFCSVFCGYFSLLLELYGHARQNQGGKNWMISLSRVLFLIS